MIKLRSFSSSYRERIGPATFYLSVVVMAIASMQFGPIGLLLLAGQLGLVLLSSCALMLAMYGWYELSIVDSGQFAEFKMEVVASILQSYAFIAGGLAAWVAGGLLLKELSGAFMILRFPPL